MEKTIEEVAKVASPNIEKFVALVTDYLQSGVEVAKEQAPVFIDEILRWGFYSNIAIFLLFFGMVIFYLLIVKRWYKHEIKQNTSHYSDGFGIFTTVGGGLSFIGLIMALCAALKVIKILVAPRLYLIDYLGNLIN